MVMGAIKQRESYTCLLTGRPCGLVPVTLRRMVIIPPIFWIGWRAGVILPLAKAPALAFWQYLRLLRPFVIIIALIFSSLGFRALLGTEPDSLQARGLGFAALAVALTLWFVLGRLLKEFEFVRLLRYNNAQRTVTIRFSSAELAQHALEVLVLADEAGLDDVLTAEREQPPRTRPIFRYVAGGTAVMLAITAIGVWFGAPEPDAWKVAMGMLGLSVVLAVITVRRG